MSRPRREKEGRCEETRVRRGREENQNPTKHVGKFLSSSHGGGSADMAHLGAMEGSHRVYDDPWPPEKGTVA